MFRTLEIGAVVVIAIMMLGPLSMAPAYVAPEDAKGAAATPTGSPASEPPLSAAEQ